MQYLWLALTLIYPVICDCVLPHLNQRVDTMARYPHPKTAAQQRFLQAMQTHIEPPIPHTIDRTLNDYAQGAYQWQCQTRQQHMLADGVTWIQWQCSGQWPTIIPEILTHDRNIKDLIINLIDADLIQNPQLQVIPVLASEQPLDYREPLIHMAKRVDLANSKVLAGINGGYFFIPPEPPDQVNVDNNCWWKTLFSHKAAHQPVSSEFTGDGLTIIDGQVHAYNCDTYLLIPGLASPARATLLKTPQGSWHIQNVAAGHPAIDATDALGAGPMLIQQGRIDMQWQGIASTFEFSANSAVALAKDSHQHPHLLLFTVDGHDGQAGMYSFEMANFLQQALPRYRSTLQIEQAMSMDQGGSTNMVVRTQQSLQVVSSSGETNRPIFNGLLIKERSQHMDAPQK